MGDVIEVANSAPFWIFAFIIIGIVIFQAIIFLRIAKKSAPDVGMTQRDERIAMRTGLITAIGPSVAVAIVIISLITILGSPITLMRIGIIGSAATESGAAQVGANAFGTELGGDDFPIEALATVVWTMFLGGMGWLIVVALFTKQLGKTQKKIEKNNPKIMSSVTLAAMLGAFGFLVSDEMIISINHTIAGIVAVGSMIGFMIIADKLDIAWIKEWSLGFSMVIGMTVAHLTTMF
ncbi:DUF5058 family protein [Salicibibacter cibi]|uniref:DUF5058 family protein n=1 Tax=Salicibibacter cibi TaxID=2743001 RepID=A0A7T6Z9K0_9BACI|nr:DUF5058 family protein [Salicibibacter cibi]QQK79357.1 DUF5058 family protein [Salicibibacter cibi]